MKRDIGIILSLIALVGVAILAILWGCRFMSLSTVSLDTFIGVMAAMIGLLVTFAIGWQVVNALDIKSKLAEIEKLKGEITEQRIEINRLVTRSKFDSNVNQSYTMHKLDSHHRAFACTLEAIKYGLALDDAYEELDVLLVNLKVFAVNSQREHCYQSERDMMVAADEMIQKSPKFALIKDKYTDALSEYNKFFSSVFPDPKDEKNTNKK
jgi:lipoprotein